MSAAINAGLSLDTVRRRRGQAFEKLAQSWTAPILRPKPRAIQTRFARELGCERQTPTRVLFFLLRWRIYVETASGPNKAFDAWKGSAQKFSRHGVSWKQAGNVLGNRAKPERHDSAPTMIHTVPKEASTSKTKQTVHKLLQEIRKARGVASYLLESFEQRYRDFVACSLENSVGQVSGTGHYGCCWDPLLTSRLSIETALCRGCLASTNSRGKEERDTRQNTSCFFTFRREQQLRPSFRFP